MDVENAAGVLAGSILTGLAIVIIVITVVVINNIIHKYWKPVTLWRFPEYPNARFAEPHEISSEKIPPTLEDIKKV